MNIPDFSSLLLEHGFSLEADEFGELDATSRGFYHEIYNSLIHDSPVFREQSEIRIQLDVPSAMICCDLLTHAGDIDAAVAFFYRRWYEELRYQHPVRELLIQDRTHHSAQIRALIIGRRTAMSFLFNIQ